MIIPSIDIMDGQTVQLVGGKEKALDAGDPLPIAEKFALAGDVDELLLEDLRVDVELGRGRARRARRERTPGSGGRDASGVGFAGRERLALRERRSLGRDGRGREGGSGGHLEEWFRDASTAESESCGGE